MNSQGYLQKGKLNSDEDVPSLDVLAFSDYQASRPEAKESDSGNLFKNTIFFALGMFTDGVTGKRFGTLTVMCAMLGVLIAQKYCKERFENIEAEPSLEEGQPFSNDLDRAEPHKSDNAYPPKSGGSVVERIIREGSSRTKGYGSINVV